MTDFLVNTFNISIEDFERLEAEHVELWSHLHFQLVRLSVIGPTKDEVNRAADVVYMINVCVVSERCGDGVTSAALF